MNHRDWAGPVALVLAVGVSVGFAGSLLIVAATPDPLPAASAHFLATLGGAMIGAVATFLGMRIRNGGKP